MNVNTTRRSVLKMTAALATMTGAGSVNERIAAATEFAGDATAEMAAFPHDYRANPALFAHEAESQIYSMEDAVDVRKGFGENLAPEAYADLERAKALFHKMHPGATPLHGPSEWSEVEESALRFAWACFDAGIERGAVYENLRRTMLGTAQRCMQCNGVGYAHASIVTPGADLVVCEHCKGSGVVGPLDATYHYAFLEGFRS